MSGSRQVVDHTVTHGTNGLRMPYCDKAQRCADGLYFLSKGAAGC